MFPVNKKYETEMCTTNTYEIQGQGMYSILNVNCKQLARPNWSDQYFIISYN